MEADMAGERWPWSKFYWDDWLTDPDLQGSSPAARGVWIDVLCLAYKCPEPGVLCSQDGKPWSEERIVGSIRGDSVIVRDALKELVENGVARKRGDGSIYSRRMVEDCEERAANAQRMQDARTKPAQCPHNDPIVQKSSSISASRSLDSSSLSSEEGSGEKPKPPTIEIPPALDTPDFRAAWDEWLAYRRERKLGKPTGMTVKATYRRFEADLGPERAAAAIRHSIEKGWQSINEAKEFTSDNGTNRAAGARRNGAVAERAAKESREYPRSTAPIPIFRTGGAGNRGGTEPPKDSIENAGGTATAH